jgi:proteasome lid subunit RPN8/RPN11
MVMKITKQVYSEMVTAALVRHPHEMCGILARLRGSDIVTCWSEVPNIATKPKAEFVADPTRQLEAWTILESRGYEVMAAVHSHTHGSIWPSPADRDEHDPKLIMVIVGVIHLPEITAKAWKIDDDVMMTRANFLKEEIVIV